MDATLTSATPVRRPLWRDVLGLLVSLALVFAIAAIGSGATFQGVNSWYPEIAKAPWNPPSWVFGPAWTLLYILMAVAAWRVWRTESPQRRGALVLYGVQLVLNGLWSWIFFGWALFWPAAVELLALLLVVGATWVAFRRIDRVAAWLLVPYLLWLSFALSLNVAIAVLNPAGP